jgi:diguanylate cyclase (GGDEF)-like protein/PAS domain S-box-containing protein
MNRPRSSHAKASARKRSPLSRLSSSATLRALVDRLREGIYITDKNGFILDANPAFLEMLGVKSVADLRELKAGDLLVDPTQREAELRILAKDGAIREYELQLRRPDGKVRTVLDTAYGITDRTTKDTLYHGILVDITQLKEMEELLREQATRDPLTGCHNRRFLVSLAEQMDPTDAQWGAAVLDIDHFKKYNDQLGHQAGDEALVKTARFLIRQVRSEDVVCRIGGDEFLVVMAGADSKTTEQIITRLKENARCTAPVPFSIGWTVRKDHEPLERTIGRADSDLISVRVESRRFQLRNGDAQ